MREFFNLAFQFFILLTPFAVLSAFLSMTQECTARERMRVALRTGIATVIACVALLYFGNFIFMLFGIHIDAFRIGGGTILFLNAIGLVRGSGNGNGSGRAAEGKENPEEYDDVAVVPLAIPITVGPGTTAALIVMGAGNGDWKAGAVNLLSLLVAIGALTVLLTMGNQAERFFKKKGITIISKVTGLFLSAFAAQMIFQGIKNILG